jgi:aerobic-type carbon monoxide dehydrogenase small subunit (CoxS/CutS family)
MTAAGYRFDISEPTSQGWDGIVLMDGKRLKGVRCVTVVARAGEFNVVTVEFHAASVNRASFDALKVAPFLEPLEGP